MSINQKMRKYYILFYTVFSALAFVLLQGAVIKYIFSSLNLKNIFDIRDFSNIVYMFLLDGSFAAAGVLFLRFTGRQSLKNFGFGLKKKDISFAFIGFTLLILMYFIFTYLTSEMNLASWNYNFSKMVIPQFLLYATLTRFLLVGIGEEFFFRGFLFKSLAPYGRSIQYAVNMIFFISMHFLTRDFSLLYLLTLVTGTFLLCYVYEKTGSIWPSVILHGAIDFMTVLFSWNLYGVSIVELYWKSAYNIGDAFKWLYITNHILLITLAWCFYDLKIKKDRFRSAVNR